MGANIAGVVAPTTNIPTGEATGMLAMYEGNGHFTGTTAGGNMAYTGYGANAGADTFNVLGFNNQGGGVWSQPIDGSGNYFVFNEGNGTLSVANTVPEPATAVMALFGVLGMGLIWLRRK